jgi:hypothetical protein
MDRLFPPVNNQIPTLLRFTLSRQKQIHDETGKMKKRGRTLAQGQTVQYSQITSNDETQT